MANWDKIKWVRRVAADSATVLSIAPYHLDYILSKIIFSLVYGTPSTVKIGFTPGGDEVLYETDVSAFAEGITFLISVDQVPKPDQDTLYFYFPSGVYTIDVLFIQRIGA